MLGIAEEYEKLVQRGVALEIPQAAEAAMIDAQHAAHRLPRVTKNQIRTKGRSTRNFIEICWTQWNRKSRSPPRNGMQSAWRDDAARGDA